MSEGSFERKPIPKSTRFEVFKRDSFTCQYCGAKAPDVVLHIDHIHPVADGGDNSLLNLVTSCLGCNLGKSDRTLDDNSILLRQRDQLEELNERRQQLEMLLEWRQGLATLEDDFVEAVQAELRKFSQWQANESGIRDIRKWLKKHSLADLLEALETSFSQYLVTDDNGEVTSESWNRAFQMTPRIAEVKKQGGLSDDMQKIFYARGILRKRLSYLKESDVVRLMKQAVASGLPAGDLVHIAKEVRNWSQFTDIMYSWILSEDDKVR